jgi:hypothetical protein
MTSHKLHTLTHQMPGVPDHDPHRNQDAAEHAATRHRERSGHDHHHDDRRHHQRHDREPRILVRWQHWIARLFGARP